MARLEADLQAALANNPRLEAGACRIHVIADGISGEAEAVVEIAAFGDQLLMGHAFYQADQAIAYAAMILLHGRLPCDDAAACVASFRRQVLTELRFSPVYASREDATYAEAPNATAAIQRLADMIARIDPRLAVPADDEPTAALIDLRIIPTYWDVALLTE